jgi:hypothetical protein
MGMYPMGNFREECRAGLFRVALFSGLDIRRLGIRMEGTYGRGILPAPRRVRLIVPLRRILRRFVRIPIRERRLRGIWATG